ncbi:MAG: beta-N-acetylhexosaminidase, partial [Candidatus Eremiobacterota bacterium]
MKTDTAPLPDLSSLTLEQKAAQLLMIDIPDTAMTEDTRRHLSETAWNGVILFAKNVQSRQQVVELVEAIHEASPIRPWISVDQEGGLVDRFRFPEMSLSPGLMALGAAGDPELTCQAHRIMGDELADLGIGIDFAPCLDVNVNPQNPIIGARSFGEDPERVARLGQAAIRGLRDGGVASCAKHFPGHGDTSLDSHMALPVVPHDRARLEQVELKPFQAAVDAGVEAIMTAHIVFPAFDPTPGLPATLSHPILTGLLREKMGYDGVIVTDSLSMKAIADHYGMGEAAVRSVEAGADLVLALGTLEDQKQAFQALLAAVRQGRLSEARLDRSLQRLFALKRKFPGRASRRHTFDAQAHQELMGRIAAASITLVKNDGVLPLSTGNILVLSPDLLPLTPLGEVSATAS